MLHCFDGCELPVEGECWTTPQMLAREVLRGNLDVARALCDWVLETDFSPTARIPPPYYVTALEDCVREFKRFTVEVKRACEKQTLDWMPTVVIPKPTVDALWQVLLGVERYVAQCGRPGL
jgi:hypothetical protein